MSGPRPADAIVEAVRATGLLGAGAPGDAGASGEGAAGAGGPILLLCSAGRDSMALLDVAARLVGPAGLAVLHVDHGLREGAAADGELLLERAAELGVAAVVRRAEVRPEGPGNLHAWARGQRGALAEEERLRVGARLVATAHTRSDLVETALGRLATQPGRRALLSMRAREDRLVRPLLGVTREETATYCRERGLRWRDDPSNDDERYARARLRHGVVPVLRGLNPRAEAAIARTLEELAEESAVLDALVEGALRPPAPGEEGPSITAVALADLPEPLGRLVLRALCERTLARPVPRAGARLAEVLALSAPAARAGLAAVDVGAGARVELRGGVYRCRRSGGPAAPGSVDSAGCETR